MRIPFICIASYLCFHIECRLLLVLPRIFLGSKGHIALILRVVCMTFINFHIVPKVAMLIRLKANSI